MKIQDNLKNKFGERVRFNEKLSKFSWFNLGGPAEIFYKAEDASQLSEFLRFLNKQKKNVNILGAGSNTLIRDGGVEGAIIKLSSNFSYVRLNENNIIEVGAATLDKKLSDFAKENSLTGFEFLSCIPGSIGGGIIMNSGCYGEEMSQIIHSISAMDFNGNIQHIKSNEIKFFYRGCDLKKNLIILSAQFKGKLADKKIIEEKQAKLIKRKKDSQPNQIKTCGSTFKNSKNKKAWELIKESNCEKISVGNAKISEKHCNFFINEEGKANSHDIEKLIAKVQKEVFNKTNISLELEIKVIGKDR
mgnify:FL=1